MRISLFVISINGQGLCIIGLTGLIAHWLAPYSLRTLSYNISDNGWMLITSCSCTQSYSVSIIHHNYIWFVVHRPDSPCFYRHQQKGTIIVLILPDTLHLNFFPNLLVESMCNFYSGLINRFLCIYFSKSSVLVWGFSRLVNLIS